MGLSKLTDLHLMTTQFLDFYTCPETLNLHLELFSQSFSGQRTTSTMIFWTPETISTFTPEIFQSIHDNLWLLFRRKNSSVSVKSFWQRTLIHLIPFSWITCSIRLISLEVCLTTWTVDQRTTNIILHSSLSILCSCHFVFYRFWTQTFKSLRCLSFCTRFLFWLSYWDFREKFWSLSSLHHSVLC